jgi:signal transduction histidine kinase
LNTLIIEDHHDTRELLADALKRRGHSVVECGDGQEGLRAAQKTIFPLVLLDLSLPVMDGLDVCRSLRHLPGWDDSVILVCTGRDHHDCLHLALKAGADDYLMKPYDENELSIRLSIAENSVRQRNMRREGEAKLHALAAQLTVAQEQERRRLAAELHDSVGQNLSWVKIRLSELRTKKMSAECAPITDDISRTLEKIIQETRSLMFEISPPILYEMGLEAALEWLTEHVQARFGLKCSFEFSGSPTRLSSQFAVMLFQSVRELLINVVKHAKAKSATLSIKRKDDWIWITVADDGIGMDLARSTRRIEKLSGFGIFSIRERLNYMGGNLEIDSNTGCGTKIVLKAPVKEADETLEHQK